MFPDFNKAKLEIKNNFEKYIRNSSRQDPLVGSITRYFVHEGDRIIYHTVEGEKKEVTFNKIESMISIPNEEIIMKGPKAFVPKINEVVADIQKQMGRNILENLENVAKKTGNIIDAKGEELNPDFLLKAIEKMQIDFDDDGNPCMPMMVVPPKIAELLSKKIPEWEKDQAHKEKHEALMKKKKEEWNDRESNRKLVD